MKKSDELKPGSTFDKAAPDEMLFILRGQDYTAPVVIIEWIKANLYNCSDKKLREAFECAIEMRKHKSHEIEVSRGHQDSIEVLRGHQDSNMELLLQAEAQLIGFAHASKGFTISNLADSMGLTKKEWLKLRKYVVIKTSDKDDLDQKFHQGI